MDTNYVAIITVGIVATAFLTAINLGAERLRIIRGSMLHAIGSFVIPEPVRKMPVAGLMHLIAGVLFAGVYAYVFSFVKPVRIPDFISMGMLIGLVHGFFVSFFMMLGFSGLEPDGRVEGRYQRFTFPAAILNVGAHIVFGAVVGVGLGYAALTGTVMWFALYSMAGLVAVAGIVSLIMPPFRRLNPRGPILPAREPRAVTERGL